MELELVAAPVIANVLAAAALTWTSVWVRPGTYFGVRVSPEYRGSPQARRSRRSFRFNVWVATAFAVALSIVASVKGLFWLSSLGFLIQLGTATVAFRDGWRETKPHGLEAPSARTAHLFAPRPRVPGGIAAVVAPFFLLAAVFLYLRSNWEAIPVRFPIHWDLQGRANGWSNRSLLGVFGPLLIAVVILVFISGVIAALAHAARRAPAGSGLERRNRAMLIIPVIVMWMIAVMFSLAALTPLILRNGQFPVPAFVLILVPIAGLLAGIWLAARASAEADELPDDHTPNECWKWGQFYYNPDDSSILVERRFGIGYTFNFARWQSWSMVGGALALPAAILLVARQVW
jgi:uncharacterized membrane protein